MLFLKSDFTYFKKLSYLMVKMFKQINNVIKK